MASEIVVARRRPTTLARRFSAYALTGQSRDRIVLMLCLIVALGFLAALLAWPGRFPTVAITPLILLSGLYLPSRHLLALYAVMAVGLCIAVPRLPFSTATKVVVMSAVIALMVMMVIVASSRVRVGSVGFHGENLFVELRDRLSRATRMPVLPTGWTVESAVLSANGDGFSGDFLVADRTQGGRHLEVALVDVSGKGRDAGTRSLLLSGALGALLGSLTPAGFLDAANTYLVRQGWEEGFATAVHVDINLDTGQFSVGNAGHPAPVRYSAGAGTWEVLEGGRGPVLGIMRGVTFSRTHGSLGMGDALMIYSDGIIESRGHDLVEGVDRMLGAASGAMVRRGESIADAVVASARSGESDDRAVFVIVRR